MKELIAYSYGQAVGSLRQSDSGSLSFQYFSGVDEKLQLSLAMPVRESPYPSKITKSFIEGLIPEGLDTREALGREFGVSPQNPFALLEHIGLDCAGAIQFFRPQSLESSEVKDALVPCNDRVIAQRLRNLANPGQSWILPRERWSLAGAQSKFALRQENGNWYEAQGSEPTTHIFKPGIHTLKDQALNEHLCLKALGAVGMPVAHTEYREFAGVPAIVIERYDRLRLDNGQVLRLHQEDFCQATSTLPQNKYESHKGPNALKIIEVLRRGGASETEVEKFVQGLIGNYLLGAPDAHAKNYSLMHLPDGSLAFAPLYDIASALPYESGDSDYGYSEEDGLPGVSNELQKAAMAIGGERRFGKISRKHWAKFAHSAKLDEGWLRTTVRVIAERLPAALESTFEQESEAIGDSALPERLYPQVQHLCEVTVTLLDRDL